MGKLLLVAVTADEEDLLSAAVGPDACVAVPVTALREALGEDVDGVVIGSETTSPLSAVQWVHRAEPLCGVLVLTTAERDAELRRAAMYAPGMPASLTILESGSPELGPRAKDVLEAGRLGRVHERTLSVVTSRE